ncbi:SDR family oxidoreductase [Shigella flexneri]
MAESTVLYTPSASHLAIQLDGDDVNAVTRDGFKIAHDISSYSFVATAKACRAMLNLGAALLTLSYLGADVHPELQRYGSGKSVSGS